MELQNDRPERDMPVNMFDPRKLFESGDGGTDERIGRWWYGWWFRVTLNPKP